MTFTVTYRATDGALHEEAVEAASRADCAAKLKGRGIQPTGIREGRAPSRKGNATGTASPSTLPAGKAAALTGLAIVVMAGGLLWWMAAREGMSSPQDTHAPLAKPARQKVQPRAVEPRRPTEPPREPLPVVAETPARPRKHVAVITNEQGFVKNERGYVLRKIEPPPAYTNDQSSYLPKSLADRVFTNPVDRKIGFLFDLTPGEFLFGVSQNFVSKNFAKNFLESLNTPITVAPDDPPEVVELKEAVIGARAELKTLYDEGRDLREVMMQCREDLRQLGLYRKELEVELGRIAKDRTLTEAELGDFVDAANKMLAERGAAPLAMPRSAARRFEMLRNAGVQPGTGSAQGEQRRK